MGRYLRAADGFVPPLHFNKVDMPIKLYGAVHLLKDSLAGGPGIGESLFDENSAAAKQVV